ncbi:MAG: phosphoglycerate dehydrogenase [Prolixibacteraceae bacterium]|nr:phosphoglycerate dehydrogenase [Prolixibacteraceae bacterium]
MKIAVTSPSFSRNETLTQELYSLFPESKINKNGLNLDGKELIEFIKDAEGIIVGLERINQDVIAECPNLKIISKYGVGLDNLDIEYCKRMNISIGWTPGVNRLSVAEMSLAFMLMLVRKLFVTSLQLKNGFWNKDGGANLSGKVVGIIGVGNIGKELIRLLKPYNCKVLVNDIIDQRSYYEKNSLTESTKEDIYRNADFISIHTPLTTLTKYMINRNVFLSMKKTAFLINTARGSIVKSDDLKWALQNNVIAGAAIDVYEDEPPKDKEMLCLPNLICTPHIGGNSLESVLAMGRSAIRHLQKFFIENKNEYSDSLNGEGL